MSQHQISNNESKTSLQVEALNNIAVNKPSSECDNDIYSIVNISNRVLLWTSWISNAL